MFKFDDGALGFDGDAYEGTLCNGKVVVKNWQMSADAFVKPSRLSQCNHVSIAVDGFDAGIGLPMAEGEGRADSLHTLEVTLRLLTAAFQAGKEQNQAELRKLLGFHQAT